MPLKPLAVITCKCSKPDCRIKQTAFIYNFSARHTLPLDMKDDPYYPVDSIGFQCMKCYWQTKGFHFFEASGLTLNDIINYIDPSLDN